jgi:hypothetical protein
VPDNTGIDRRRLRKGGQDGSVVEENGSADMNRSEFLRDCSGGLCACIVAPAASAGGSVASEATTPEDWRLRFVRQRYGKLIGILSGEMDQKALDRTLHELGAYCSSTDPRLMRYQGDLEGYCKHLKETASGDEVAVDRERNIITVTSPPRADCFCPWISVENRTPAVACNCSLGWHQATWETVTGKKVEVELKESVLRGGTRCVFEVRVLQASA